MNAEKLEKYRAAYLQGLALAVEKDLMKPTGEREYSYDIQGVPVVVARMVTAMEVNPERVNYVGAGFRATCKILGINATKKALFDFLEVEKARAPR